MGDNNFIDLVVAIGDYGILKERNVLIRELEDEIHDRDIKSFIQLILNDLKTDFESSLTDEQNQIIRDFFTDGPGIYYSPRGL